MKIISHRGAAGLALENTLKSIAAGKAAAADAIEIDVRLTKDKQLVLVHNATLRKVAGKRMVVADHTLAELKAVPLKDGQTIATLKEALAAAVPVPLLIEAKGDGWAEVLHQELIDVDPTTIYVIARNHEQLGVFHQLNPSVTTYLVQRFNPVDLMQALQDAQRMGFSGIDLNFWLLNPLTYWLARRAKLDIIVYTLDWRFIARFLLWLFPEIHITTNRPDRLGVLRTERSERASIS